MKKYIFSAVMLVLLLVAAVFISRTAPQGVAQKVLVREVPAPAAAGAGTSTAEFAKVIYVFDGDTIEVTGGEHVRYIGMDAPEEPYSKKANATNQCYADEAKSENDLLVMGKMVRLVKDARDRDVYGRLLRYVYVAVGSTSSPRAASGEIFVNEELVRDGFAKAAAYPPDIKFKNEFNALEKIAKENKRGLWGACE